MAIELHHIGEALVEAMANEDLDLFYELCGETRPIGVDWEVCAEMELEPWGDYRFDGMAKVDLGVRIGEDLVVPVEIKLGTTRLRGTDVDGWLEPWKPSRHKPPRWNAKMMAILDRRYPEDVAEAERAPLEVVVAGRRLKLTDHWIVIARQDVVRRWVQESRLEFRQRVKRLDFDVLARKLGAERFDRIVRDLIGSSHFDRWVEPPL